MVQAQTPYSCRYWFDNDYSNHSISTSTTPSWNVNVNVNALNEGFHTLYLQITEPTGELDIPQSHIFYKPAFTNSTDIYQCWIDQNHTNLQSGTVGSGFTLNVASLSEGFHSVFVRIGEGATMQLQSFIFYKPSNTIGSDAYQCWFDQDRSIMQSGIVGSGFSLDVSSMSEGFHTVYVRIGEDTKEQVQSFIFYKPAIPSSTDIYQCWFDQNHSNMQSGMVGSGFSLDVSSLSEGFHTVYVRIGEGTAAQIKSYIFYKPPEDCNEYVYWFDNNTDNPVSGTLAGSSLLIDVNHLSIGDHDLNIRICEYGVTKQQSFSFYKSCPDISVVDSKEACDSLTWNGITYYSSTNTPTFTTTTSDGCDSTTTLHLTINNSTTDTITKRIFVDSLPYTVNSVNYNSTGVYTQHLTNAVGCDSLLIIDLAVSLHSLNDTVTTTPGTPITISPTLNDTINCDSPTVTIITQPLNGSIGTGSNEGTGDNDSLFWTPPNGPQYSGGGNTIPKIIYTPNGIGRDSIQIVVACDSLNRDTSWIYILTRPLPDNIVNATCTFPPDSNAFEMVERYACPGVNSMTTPMVADMDGDGFPEIIACNNTSSSPWYSSNLLVFDGRTGTLKKTILTPEYVTHGQCISIADVDNDGQAEIFLLDRSGYVMCYNYSGVRRWLSDGSVSYNFLLSVADIMGDGTPELVCGDHIYNAVNGTLLLQGSTAETGRGFAAPHGYSASYYIPYYMYALADIDNDGTLELCAGNTVYKINITNHSGTTGNSWTSLRQANNNASITNYDGQTFITDFDGDGDMDICVIGTTHALAQYPYVSSHTIFPYVWDGQTSEIIAYNSLSVGNQYGASIPFSGDLDGNGKPEIVFSVCNIGMNVYTFDNSQPGNMRLMHSHAPFGETSGFTVFDFNQDGHNEIVYRGTTNMFIVDGTTLDTLCTPITSYSGTIAEYPVVADVDGDGHAEIVVARAYNPWPSSSSEGYISVYGSSTPGVWSSARKVWNQWAYSVVNINEDLTVPRYRFNVSTRFSNGTKPFNGFLHQVPYLDLNGNMFNPVADIVADSVSGQLVGDSIELTIHYQNQGDIALQAPFGITVYRNSYRNTVLWTDTVRNDIDADSIASHITKIPKAMVCGLIESDSLVIALNDMGIGIAQHGNQQPECDTTNNTVKIATPVYHSTGDTTAVACDSFSWWNTNYTNSTNSATHTFTNAAGCDSVVTLHLTVNHSTTGDTTAMACNSFTWYGTTYSATGDYVRTWQSTLPGGCDSTVTLHLTVNPIAVLIHTPDTTILIGGSITLHVNNIDNVTWYDSNGNILSTTDSIVVSPTTPTTYYIAGFNQDTSIALNGDFEAGNVNFTSGYTYTSNLVPEGKYYVGPNAHNYHSGFPNWPDHTTGNGNYMIVNGTISNGVTVWSQTVPVTPNTDYDFSAWVCNVSLGNPSNVAYLQFSINGVQLGNIFHCPASLYTWEQFYEVWNSGDNSSATISILNLNTSPSGNDFGIDDIRFSALTSCIGYDSIHVNVQSVSHTYIDICENQLPYIWNGNTFTTEGEYNVPIPNPSGIDSIATLHLTVNHSTTGDTTAVVCDSLTWWNTNYTNSTNTPTHVYTNAAGCDSTVTLHLTVNHSSSGDTTAVVCDSFTWWNANYTNSTNTPTHVYANADGCDSTVTLNLTVNYSNTGTDSITACNSTVWHGNTYTENTSTPTFTSLNEQNCDSVTTLVLTINHCSTRDTTVADSLVIGGTTYTDNDTIIIGFDTIILTVCHTVRNTIDTVACDQFSWNNMLLTHDTVILDTVQKPDLCDSITILNVIVNPMAVLTHTPDTTITAGDMITLWATGATWLTWTDSNGAQLSNTGYLTVHPTITTSYYVSSFSEGPNLVYNGDFELGNTGFTNDYIYGNTGSYGHYHVGHDIAEMWPWDSPGFAVHDHTSNSGMFLMIDGAIQPMTRVWSQTVEVTPHTDYLFSSWVLTDNSGYFKYEINGVQTGFDYVTPEAQWVWKRYSQVWNSDTCTHATLSIVNRFSQSAGYDYCIDDITFSPLTSCSVTDTVTVSIYTYTHIDSSICADELPFVWYNNTLSSSGIYTDTVYAGGNDTIITLTLSVNPVYHDTINDTICDNGSSLFEGVNYTSAGLYTVPFHTTAGCDSIRCLNLTVNLTASVDTIAVVCDSLTWWNTNYTNSTNTPTHVYTNAAGCDSTVTLHLTVNHSSSGDTTAVVCDSFTWWNTNYTNSTNTPTHVYTNAAGCDSTVTLHLTVNYSSSGDTTAVVCDSFTWWNTNYTNSTNTTTHVYSNAAGCDSTVTLHLTVNHSNTSDTSASVCDSMMWHGITYTTSQNPTFTIPNFVGCDSVVTLYLTVNHSTTGDTTVVACDSLTWWNTNYTNSTNTPTHVYTNAVGCDSTVTLHLTVNHSSTEDTSATACDSMFWHGNYYSQSGNGIASFVTTNGAGCDSTVTLNLTLNHASDSTVTVSVVENLLPYTFNSLSFNNDTSLLFILPNASNCDSAIHFSLTIIPNTVTVLDTSICETLLPFTWNDSVFLASGTKQYTTLSYLGSDSTVVMNVEVIPTAVNLIYDTVIENNLPYSFMGNLYTSDTIGDTTHLVGYTGCDSIVVFNLHVHRNVSALVDSAICSSQLPLTWNGFTFTLAGVHTVTLTASTGADSVLTMALNVMPGYMIKDTVDICPDGLPLTWRDTTFATGTTSGLYTRNHHTVAGCDSICSLQLNVHPTYLQNETLEICNSALPFTWLDTTFQAGTTTSDHTLHLTSFYGCDSSMSLHLVVNQEYSINETLTLCDNLLPYTWHDTVLGIGSTSGTYTINPHSSHGCDSIMTLSLTVNPSNSAQDIQVHCDSFTWTDGITYYESTTQPSTTTLNHFGCDSVVSLNLTIHHSASTVDSVTSCIAYVWIDGNTYTNSTDSPTITVQTIQGCDSVVSLHFEMLPASYTDLADSFCTGTQYQFGTHILSEGGTYTDTLTAYNTCDSIVSLNLTKLSKPTIIIEQDSDCSTHSYQIHVETDVNHVFWTCNGSEWNHNWGSENSRNLTITTPKPITLTLLVDYNDYPTCFNTAEVTLQPIIQPHAVMTVSPEFITYETPTLIAISQSTNAKSIQWYIDDDEAGNTQSISYTPPSGYDSVVVTLIAYSDMCVDTAVKTVPIRQQTLYVPNAFTPNESTNNKFSIFYDGIIEYELNIYNRQGILIFHSNTNGEAWDGRLNGTPCPQGSYVWIVKYRSEVDPGNWHVAKGTVTLLY